MVIPLHLSVKQRVDQMIAGAKARYGCHLAINQSHRTAEQAQQFHICHMFLHNFFKHLKPKHVSADGRTIDWNRLSDPTVTWDIIPRPEQDFLRTKNHQPAQRQLINGRANWVAGYEPDKQSTIHAMKQFLQNAHVTSMAAPGKHLCGESCGCGGHASKHITGLACDVGGMDRLGQLILTKNRECRTMDEAVDHFLAEYGLWRPLAHLPGKAREVWHLEALPAHHRHPHPVQKADPSLHHKLALERSSHHYAC